MPSHAPDLNPRASRAGLRLTRRQTAIWTGRSTQHRAHRLALCLSVKTRHQCTTTPATVPGIVGGMIDHPPLPDFGDELGLYRLVRWAKARVRASARPAAERAAILAEIERQYRAALQAELAERRPREKRPG